MTTGITGRQIRDRSIEGVDLAWPVYTAIRPGWKDITAPVVARTTGPTAPTWAQVGSTIFWDYRIAIGNEFFSNFHIDHDYMPGGDVFLHVHWYSAGTAVQPVRWQIDYAIAKGHAQGADSVFNFETPFSVTLTQAPASQYQHMVTEMSASVPKDRLEPDTIIKARFRRITNGATDNSDGIFGIMADCHFQTDRMATPQRAPNFYLET
jgi:hypothetical protein